MTTSAPDKRSLLLMRLPIPWWISTPLKVLVYSAFALLAIGIIYLLLNPPFGEHSREITDLTGDEVSQDFQVGWPAGIVPAEVQKMSCKHASAFDSHSAWYRIRLSPAAAAKWRDAIHSKRERQYEPALGHRAERIEGVHRIERGPPLMHQQTGTTPKWWSPPAIDFRATELMKWYRDYDSGVGSATYSGIDESTNTLWVYEYSCQHDLLWSRGNVPAGQQFSTMKQAVQREPDGDMPPGENSDDKTE
jgi:hypothetical protein